MPAWGVVRIHRLRFLLSFFDLVQDDFLFLFRGDVAADETVGAARQFSGALPFRPEITVDKRFPIRVALLIGGKAEAVLLPAVLRGIHAMEKLLIGVPGQRKVFFEKSLDEFEVQRPDVERGPFGIAAVGVRLVIQSLTPAAGRNVGKLIGERVFPCLGLNERAAVAPMARPVIRHAEAGRTGPRVLFKGFSALADVGGHSDSSPSSEIRLSK